MDLKTYIQNREETRPSSSIEINPASLEHFKTQVAVIPPPMKVGDEKEASERTPNERFLFFLRLMVEINKFQTKREKHSNNFILERKVWVSISMKTCGCSYP